MSIFEKVLKAHNAIIALETGKNSQIKDVLAQQHATLGGVMYPVDPAQKAAAAKQVKLNYDALIDTKKNELRATLETAERDAKRAYYDAIPMRGAADYSGEVDRIVRNHERSTLHSSARDADFFAAVREHVELDDKWALVYVLAGLELYPDNAELLEYLEEVAPEVAEAKTKIAEVETAKRLAEVFELAYFEAKGASSALESVCIKNRLAELGANPNIITGVGADNSAVYDAFVQSLVADLGVKLGIKNVKSEIQEMSAKIG